MDGLRMKYLRYRAISLLRISPRLYVPCAGPKCNKVMAEEGCPAAGKAFCATIPYELHPAYGGVYGVGS